MVVLSLLATSTALVGIVAEADGPLLTATGSTTAKTSGGTTVVNRGVCDVDGVRVSYAPEFRQVPTPGYHIGSALVTGLDPACQDARVLVQLSDEPADQDDPVGRAVVLRGQSAVRVAFADRAPLSASVNGVTVTLEGGRLPLPAACAVRYDRSFLGTTASDAVQALTGTNQNDVLFGLSGDDTYDALNGDDCIRAGDGDNVMRLGNGADVVVAGNGANRVTSSNGAGNAGDVVELGDGDNTVDLSTNGGNTVTVGRGSNTVSVGNGPNTVTVLGGPGSTTRVNSGNGTLSLSIAAGRAVIRLQGGDRSVLQLGAGDEEVYVLGGRNNVVKASPGVTTCFVPLSIRKQNDLSGCTLPLRLP